MKYPRAKPFFSKADRKEITSNIDEILESGHLKTSLQIRLVLSME